MLDPVLSIDVETWLKHGSLVARIREAKQGRVVSNRTTDVRTPGLPSGY